MGLADFWGKDSISTSSKLRSIFYLNYFATGIIMSLLISGSGKLSLWGLRVIKEGASKALTVAVSKEFKLEQTLFYTFIEANLLIIIK